MRLIFTPSYVWTDRLRTLTVFGPLLVGLLTWGYGIRTYFVNELVAIPVGRHLYVTAGSLMPDRLQIAFTPVDAKSTATEFYERFNGPGAQYFFTRFQFLGAQFTHDQDGPYAFKLPTSTAGLICFAATKVAAGYWSRRGRKSTQPIRHGPGIFRSSLSVTGLLVAVAAAWASARSFGAFTTVTSPTGLNAIVINDDAMLSWNEKPTGRWSFDRKIGGPNREDKTLPCNRVYFSFLGILTGEFGDESPGDIITTVPLSLVAVVFAIPAGLQIFRRKRVPLRISTTAAQSRLPF